jgi:hypothetical protein
MRTQSRNVFQITFLLSFVLAMCSAVIAAQQTKEPAPSTSPEITNETVFFLLDRFPAKQVADVIGSSKSPVQFQLDDASIGSLIARGADSGVLQAMFNAMMKSHGQLTNPPVIHPLATPTKPSPTRIPDQIVLNDIVEAKLPTTTLDKKKLGGKILLDVETGDAKPPLITHSDMYDLYFYNVNKILFSYKVIDQFVSTAPVGGDLAELKDALAAVTSAFQASTSTTAASSKAASTKTSGRAEENVKPCFDLSPALSDVTKAVQEVQQDLSGPGFSAEDSTGSCHHVPYALTKGAWEAAKLHYGRVNDCANSASVQCAMQKLGQQLNQNHGNLCQGTDVVTAYIAYNRLHEKLQSLANRFADVETMILPDSRVAVPFIIQHQFIDVNSTGSMQIHETDCGSNSSKQVVQIPKPDDKQPVPNAATNSGGTQEAQDQLPGGSVDAANAAETDTGKAADSSTTGDPNSGSKQKAKSTVTPKVGAAVKSSAAPVDTDISPQSYKLTSGRDALSASAGLLLTSLQSRSYTFAATPSGSGRILQVDGMGSFRPALSALLNYDIPYLPNYKDIGFAASAGLIVDLANGKADTSNFGFFVGPSVHLFHRFFISPGWHFGQFADYPAGFGQNPSQVITNNNLGTPVPIKRYTGRFAISLTFQVPTPSAKAKSDSGVAPATPKPNPSKPAPGASQLGGKPAGSTESNP